MAKRKRTKKDLQNTPQKTKDWTITPTVCNLFELQPDNRHRGPLSNPPYEESSVG
jgi:hypothetical protein